MAQTNTVLVFVKMSAVTAIGVTYSNFNSSYWKHAITHIHTYTVSS